MRKALTILFSFLFIIFMLIFQINFLNMIKLDGIVPNIGIVLISALGIFSGEKIGFTSGIIYGLLLDSFIGKTFGMYLILYSFLGMLAGYLNEKVAKDRKMSLAIMVIVGTVAFDIIYMLHHKVLYHTEIGALFMFKVLVLELIYNLFLTYVFFRPFRFMGEFINKSKKNYYNLRGEI